MRTRNLFFYTAKAALFQFYAFVVFVLLLAYIKLTIDISEKTVMFGALFYVAIVVSWAFYIDRVNRGSRGV